MKWLAVTMCITLVVLVATSLIVQYKPVNMITCESKIGYLIWYYLIAPHLKEPAKGLTKYILTTGLGGLGAWGMQRLGSYIGGAIGGFLAGPAGAIIGTIIGGA